MSDETTPKNEPETRPRATRSRLDGRGVARTERSGELFG